MNLSPIIAAVFLASPLLFSQTEEAAPAVDAAPTEAPDTGEKVRPAAEVPA